MRRTWKLQDLDCANCAAKLEAAICKINGVVDAKVNFMSQKLTLEAPDHQMDSILEEAKCLAKKIEPDLVIVT